MGGQGSGGHNEGAEPIEVPRWTRRALSTATGKLRILNHLRQLLADATNHTEIQKASELRRAYSVAVAAIDTEREFELRERELATAAILTAEVDADEDIMPPTVDVAL